MTPRANRINPTAQISATVGQDQGRPTLEPLPYRLLYAAQFSDSGLRPAGEKRSERSETAADVGGRWSSYKDHHQPQRQRETRDNPSNQSNGTGAWPPRIGPSQQRSFVWGDLPAIHTWSSPRGMEFTPPELRASADPVIVGLCRTVLVNPAGCTRRLGTRSCDSTRPTAAGRRDVP